MSASIRKEVITLIKELPDEQVVAIWELVKAMRHNAYSEETDPLLNGELLFSGASDLSERVEDIMEQEFGLKAKDDTE